MTSDLRRSTRATAAVAVVGVVLVAFGSVLLLVAVGLGIERGEMTVDVETQGFANRLDRAAYLALALSLAAAFAGSVVLFRAGFPFWLRAHRGSRLAILFVASVVCSYAGMLLLNYGSSCLPLRSLSEAIGDFILRMTP